VIVWRKEHAVVCLPLDASETSDPRSNVIPIKKSKQTFEQILLGRIPLNSTLL